MLAWILSDLITDFLTWPGTETLIKIVGLAGVIVAAYFAFKRATAMEIQTRVLQDQLAISKRADSTEQFNSAVAQLAHDRPEIRIGGLYTLKRLGEAETSLRVSIQEILAAYIQGRYIPSRKKKQRFFPISFISDFFRNAQNVPLPKKYKSTAELADKLQEVLEAAKIVDGNGAVIDENTDIFDDSPIDPYLIVEKIDGLGSGLDASSAINYILKACFYSSTKLEQDVRIAFTIATHLADPAAAVVDLSRSRLNHAVLTDMDFKGFSFDASRFLASDISFSTFSKCDLTRADFRGCHMHCTSFIESILTHASFDFSKSWSGGRKDYADKGRDLLGDDRTVTFRDSTLEFSDFRYAILYNSDFAESRHYNSQFGYCHLQGSNFSHAVLHHSQFGAAGAYNCDFRGADIAGCSFDAAKLKGADFSDCRIQLNMGHEKGELRRSSVCFSGADLQDVKFQNSDLHGADFRGSLNLTLDQLAKARDLQGAQFDAGLQRLVEQSLPHLLGDAARSAVC